MTKMTSLKRTGRITLALVIPVFVIAVFTQVEHYGDESTLNEGFVLTHACAGIEIRPEVGVFIDCG